MANYSIKSIDQTKYGEYQCFGWVRSKRDYSGEEAKVRSKAPQMYVKRRNGFSYNPRLLSLESDYERLSKKKRHKGAAVIVGIIFFILMIAFLAVAGIELYYGISKGAELSKYPAKYYFYNNNGEKVEANFVELAKGEQNPEWTIGSRKGLLEIKRGKLNFCNVTKVGEEEKKDIVATATLKGGVLTVTTNTATPVTSKYFSDACKLETKVSSSTEEVNEEGTLAQIKEILDNVHNEYLSKVTGLFEGKTNETTGEYTDGIADKLEDMIPLAGFISADTLVGLIAFILFIVCLIIFCECSAKTGKKFAKRQAKIAGILSEAKTTVQRMKENDMSLMNKGERKMYMWETVISNGIRKANGGDDEDDD